MDELPPLPWRLFPVDATDDEGDPIKPWHIIAADSRPLMMRLAEDSGDAAIRHTIRSVNALADPDVLALAEHLNAMDPLQRGAALDEIRHAIGDW